MYAVAAAPVEELKAKGASVASSPAEAAKDVESVVTMLPSSPHVKQVSRGRESLHSHQPPATAGEC